MYLKLASSAAVLTLAAGLAACSGGEDFSDVELPGCPAGAICEEQLVGDVLVRFVGPTLYNVGYRCGTSLGYIRSEDENIDDSEGRPRTLPAGAAVCPTNATQIEFYLGHGTFAGNTIPLGVAALPQLSKAVWTDGNNDAWTLVQLTVADIVNSPAREPLSNAKVRNRGALLLALDSAPADSNSITLHEDLHDLVNDEYKTLVQGKTLDQEDYQEFQDAWQPLLDAANSANLNSDDQFPTATEVEDRLSYGTEMTRAGSFDMAFQFITNIINPIDGEQRMVMLEGNTLVLPSGQISGLLRHARQEKDAQGDSSLLYGYLAINGGSRLDDALVLQDARLLGIDRMNDTDTSDLTLAGRFTGDYMFAGLQHNRRRDYELTFPRSVHKFKTEEFGHASGQFLGAPTADLQGANKDGSLPIMAVRSSQFGDSGLVPAEVMPLPAHYRVSLRRGCYDDQPEQGLGCAPIESQNNQNYPQVGEGDAKQPLFEQDRPGPITEAAGAPTEMCLLMDLDSNGRHVLLYASADGSCPQTAADGTPVGYVARVEESDTGAKSAFVSFLMAGDATVSETMPYYGAEVMGRFDYSDSCAPLYRLSEQSVKDQVAAAWSNTYARDLFVKENTVDLQDPEEDAEKLKCNEAGECLATVQGSVEWQQYGATCP
ncbi:hypothetical protein [Isoalcanivorax beigongshangi]|uniref:Lipoprotein n=1 Tax=Isoalcanivorax beigongshangi TaxID=3238810 RepID=A0ABV4AHH8_9GAMM